MRDYPFTILDVAGILNLKVRRRQSTDMDVDCPFCGHKKGKMNLNFAKNVFRCNYCGESGGMIELYSKVFQISNAQAFAEICEILHDDKKADALPKPIYTPDMEQIPKADLEIRHQTYSMLLSQLILSKDHQKNLMERGLDAEQIVKYGYKSTPAFGFHKIVSAIMARECVLEGVPGFYTKKNNTYGINFNKHASGILHQSLCISYPSITDGRKIHTHLPFPSSAYSFFPHAGLCTYPCHRLPQYSLRRYVSAVQKSVLMLCNGLRLPAQQRFSYRRRVQYQLLMRLLLHKLFYPPDYQ